MGLFGEKRNKNATTKPLRRGEGYRSIACVKQRVDEETVLILPSLRPTRVQKFSRSGRKFSPTFIGLTGDNVLEIHFGSPWRYLYVFNTDAAAQAASLAVGNVGPANALGLLGGEAFNGWVRNFVPYRKNPPD